jgi:hypothetical protein
MMLLASSTTLGLGLNGVQHNTCYYAAACCLMLFFPLCSWLARAFSKAAPVAARGITKYYRKKLVKTAFSRALEASLLPKPSGPSSPPLTTTAVQLMDFMLPSSAVAWGYFFIMLQHLATMLNAYMPELLFVGEVGVTRL